MKTCEQCGMTYASKRKDQRYCTPACSTEGHRADSRRYYAANREQVSRLVQKYRSDNAEKIRLAKQLAYAVNRQLVLAEKRAYWVANKVAITAYRAANKDALDSSRREYVKRNEARLRKQDRERRLNTTALRAAQNKAWRLANPEACKIKDQKRRVRISENLFQVTARDWTRCLARYKHSCAYCGAKVALHIEHVIPISRDGRHSIGNLLPACAACNLSKHAQYLTEWRIKQARMERI